jgi:MFS family permease
MFDTDIIQGITIYSAALVPIILSAVQAFKLTGWVKDKYAPFLSIGVGIGICFLLAHDAFQNISSIILAGILFGLSASGLYSGLSTTAAAIREERFQKEQKRAQRESQKTDKRNKI